MSVHMKPLKIFRFAIFGAPEVGKTCFCSMYTSHVFFQFYDHTLRAQFYMKSVRASALPTFIQSADDIFLLSSHFDANGSKSKSSKKNKSGKKNKAIKRKKKTGHATRYGVQLQDTPGEINMHIDPGTVEGFALDTVFDKSEPVTTSFGLNVHANEETPLRKIERSSRSADVERNRLHDKTKSHAFIVMFDARHDVNKDSPQSLEKALIIVENLLEKFMDTKHPPPIILFGNKVDVIDSADNAKRLYRSHASEVRRRLNLQTRPKGPSAKHKQEDFAMYYGSVRRNECWKMENGTVSESREDALTLDQLIDAVVQKMDSRKQGSVGEAYLRLQKEEKERKIRESLNKSNKSSYADGGHGNIWCNGCFLM